MTEQITRFDLNISKSDSGSYWVVLGESEPDCTGSWMMLEEEFAELPELLFSTALSTFDAPQYNLLTDWLKQHKDHATQVLYALEMACSLNDFGDARLCFEPDLVIEYPVDFKFVFQHTGIDLPNFQAKTRELTKDEFYKDDQEFLLPADQRD